MDHFRSLYKTTNPTRSPKNCKRKEANEIRANKRSELYSSTRNISPSPSSSERLLCSANEDQKENCKAFLPNRDCSEAEKLPESEKLTRRKAHVLKFLAWKAEKAKQAQIKEKSKRPPFVVCTRNFGSSTEQEVTNNNIRKPYSFAPANHIFRPPVTLQSLELKVIDSNSVRLINGIREETYRFLGTPKKKTEANKGPMPTSRGVTTKPIANTRLRKMPLNPKNVLETAVNMQELAPPSKRKANPVSKPIPVLPPIKRPTFKALKKSNSSISNAFLAVAGNTKLREEAQSGAVLRTLGVAGDTKAKDSKVVPISGKNLVAATSAMTKTPLNFKTKLDSKANAQEKKSKLKTNNVLPKPKPPKSVLPPIKRTTFKAPKETKTSISKAVAENTHFLRGGGGSSTVKLFGKLVSKKTRTEANKPELKQIQETPTDPNLQGYPSLNVLTSTQKKSLSSKESSANSLFVEMDQLISPVDDAKPAHPANVDEKFNFVRYSVVEADASKLNIKSHKVTDEVVHVTPDKAAGSHTPTTYLSPYVSVSRGKVGIKTERDKRNSFYMSVDKSVKEEDADITAKVRHTMATVHYYRKQLNDEIARLDSQCEIWQKYKETNAHLVEDTGSDMINVTIGQTKLLTTKKLKQFGDLIDRCEDGAMGKKSLGKGDGAKPILTEDLEGFWSMVCLQIENVDKRFSNLQRWMENNWTDPDEIPIKSTKSKKIQKLKPGSAVGPNRDLQKLLRNAQAAYLRKKKTITTSGFDEDVILTPSKSRQVLIRDRRSRSAAATVITVNTPKVSRKSSVLDQTTPTGNIEDKNLLSHIHGFRKSMNLFKSTLLNEQEKKSPAPENNFAISIITKRKSILKTPGSIRRRPKSVFFNSPTLQFTVEDKVEDESPPQSLPSTPSKLKQIDVEKDRTYSLRTRNIKLRDPADIIIPK